MADRSMFSGWPFPPMRETNETIDAAELPLPNEFEVAARVEGEADA